MKYLNDQTDLFLEFNDKDAADPRIVWDVYKAYMRGMVISYTSQSKKKKKKMSEWQRNLK